MQLEDVTEMCESYSEEIEGHRARQEELARHVENLVDEVQRERGAREQAMKQLDVAHDAHDVELRRERRIIEAKESALQFALNDLSRTQSLLSQRELDLSAVQTALQTLEAESRKLGETHTTARFSLQLEVDRLKRDVERLQDELSRARKDIEERETAHRERDAAFDKLHAENRDLASQLASQTQARLNVAEKLDGVQASLRTAESELVTFRSRIVDLEQRLSKDQRTLLTAETQYRDQLTERNTLLLTIYQYMDKILGVDKTPVSFAQHEPRTSYSFTFLVLQKGGNAETKPFTNFSVFHDNLITRLKALSQIQLDFDKRCKDTEAKFADKLNEMKRQLENRWKQLDKFEASVKVYAETKAAWRRKISSKEGELEAIKVSCLRGLRVRLCSLPLLQLTNSELAAQLVSIKKPGQTDAMEFRSLTSRAANAERRLANAQNQLVSCEEKIAAMNQKTAAADSKWEARVKEYEARLKAAEERVKRERQGSKERIAELENNHRCVDISQLWRNELDPHLQEPSTAARSGSETKSAVAWCSRS
jgi:chromosome segregation ATPase